jgi:arsenate reductase
MAERDVTQASAGPGRNVLFICTVNSGRSILAEGLMNHLAQGRFKAYSAGSRVAGMVNPLALQVLAAQQIPTAGLRSKTWKEFTEPGAPIMDFVFTVCDGATGEACPAWPGQPLTAYWGVPDPAEVQGSEAVRLQAFADVATTLRLRIEALLALPLDELEPLAVQREIQRIGAQGHSGPP